MRSVRTITWPFFGNRRVFRIVAGIRLLAVWAGAAAATACVVPWTIAPLALVLGCGAMLGCGGSAWAVLSARREARRVEVAQSFANLAILHRGFAIQLDDTPVIGAYTSRRAAVHGALAVGTWAVVVRAYDRYWVLAGHRATSIDRPVAFRNSAIADIVPSVLSGDEPISA